MKREIDVKKQREMVSFRASSELIEEARGAASKVPGLTLNEILEKGLERQLAVLRRKHNKSKPFRKKKTLKE